MAETHAMIQIPSPPFLDRFQRASTAFLAASDLCSGVNFAALALPPFRPPIRPDSTAAAFLPSYGSVPLSLGSTVWLAMAAAIEFRSRGLPDRFGTIRANRDYN